MSVGSLPGTKDNTSSRTWTQLLALDLTEPGCHEIHQEEADVQFTRDGRAVLRTDAHQVTVIDIRTGDILAEDRDGPPVVSSVLSQDGTRLAVVRGQSTEEDHNVVVRNVTVRVTDLATGTLCHVLAVNTLRGNLTFNADCTLLAATADRYDARRRHQQCRQLR